MAVDGFDELWAAELVFVVDAETQEILDACGDGDSCLGLMPEDLIGVPLFASVHSDDLDSAMAAFATAVEHGRATWEGRVQQTDGSFVQLGWEGRLGLDGRIYARSRDNERARKLESNLRVYERLADMTADLLIVADRDGWIVQANQAVPLAHNVVGEQLPGRHLSDFVTPEGKAVLMDFPRRLANGEAVIDFRIPTVDGLGGTTIMEGTASFDEVTDRWYVVERDVTERVAHEEELRITRRFFDLSSSQLLLIDAEDRVVRVNLSFLRDSDWTRVDVERRDVLEALRVVGGSELKKALTEVRQGRTVGEIELVSAVHGTRRRLAVGLSLAEHGGEVYLACRDVTEERALQSQLLERANRDPLTGLANRGSVMEAIERDIETGDFVALLMLDLDGFKRVNDTLGHAAGDELLVRISERLLRQTRGGDMVARMGGDEFVVLLRDIPDLYTLGLVCTKIALSFNEPFEVAGRSVQATASIGASGGNKASHSVKDLLLEADLAAYAAKESAERQWLVFNDELRKQSDFSQAVGEHLRRVLESDTFELDVVQFERGQGEVVGLGVIAPAVAMSGQRRFNDGALAAATSLGLLGPIASRLAEESLRQLSPWLRRHPDGYLDLVFSPFEVSTSGFVPMILGLLDELGINRRQLVVSLAQFTLEGAGLDHLAAVEMLRDEGVRVALAGTRADAHTLAMMSTIGVDRIEVDLAHVASSAPGSVTHMIVDTVLDVADRLGVEILIDANFKPDMVDLESLFGRCSPIELSASDPVPIGEFLLASGVALNS